MPTLDSYGKKWTELVTQRRHIKVSVGATGALVLAAQKQCPVVGINDGNRYWVSEEFQRTARSRDSGE